MKSSAWRKHRHYEVEHHLSEESQIDYFSHRTALCIVQLHLSFDMSILPCLYLLIDASCATPCLCPCSFLPDIFLLINLNLKCNPATMTSHVDLCCDFNRNCSGKGFPEHSYMFLSKISNNAPRLSLAGDYATQIVRTTKHEMGFTFCELWTPWVWLNSNPCDSYFPPYFCTHIRPFYLPHVSRTLRGLHTKSLSLIALWKYLVEDECRCSVGQSRGLFWLVGCVMIPLF